MPSQGQFCCKEDEVKPSNPNRKMHNIQIIETFQKINFIINFNPITRVV